MKTAVKIITLLFIGLFCAKKTEASHFYGADLFYTYIGGYTYNVTLVVYGDCGGAAFPNLAGAAPEIKVYNGTTLSQTQSLVAIAPTAGVEVTPVCPSQLTNTNCVSPTGTIPGIKKFVYAAHITLTGPSANWKFQFTGNMGTTSQAGRSTSITNIAGGGSSVMMLEATLNNTTFVNSSALYTTIPTPFFCINKSANYNPGSVDPNGDSLSYELVSGLDASNTLVSYATGYSATQPIAYATGSFSFGNTTGQLAFTPNLVQRSLVVYKVAEYRGGILVGTSMREMTFVVLNNCNNNAPVGFVSNVSGGSALSSTSVATCRNTTLSFNINPTDADGNTINVAINGNPTGSVFNINNNNTTAPSGTFTWNVGNAAPGTYNIFVTYTDDGCPLSSKQTQVYSIVVMGDPTFSYALVKPAGCTTKAAFTVTQFVNGTWKAKFFQGTTPIDSFTSTMAVVTDSLFAGTYTMRVYNLAGCFKDTIITIASATTTQLAIDIDKPSCNKFSNGAIAITASNATAPYQYAMGTGPYASANTFTNLNSGTYAIHVKDNAGCVKDTTLQLTDSLKLTGIVIKNDVLCFGENTGSMALNVTGGNGGYVYSLNSSPLSTVNTFPNLSVNTYQLRAEDVQGCYWDTSVVVAQPPPLTFTNNLTDLTCNGDLSGAISISGNGGTTPYQYNLNNIGYVSNPNFTGLASGQYIIHVKDNNGCLQADTVMLVEPPAIKVAFLNLVNPRCYGTDGGFVIITANGGTPPLSYAANQQSFITANTVTGLNAGQHIIRIKDNLGCVKDSLITLTQPPPIESIANIVQATCTPLKNGSIILTAQGGTAGYQYAIDNGKYTTANIFKGLASGTYLLHVMDNVGCTQETNVTVTDSLAVYAGIDMTHVTCYGLANGTIKLVPAGGVDPYTVAIDKSIYQDNFAFTGLANGTYTLHIKDAIGCMADTTLTITRPDPLSLLPVITNSSCYTGVPDGKILLEVSGGTAPYTYLWSNNTMNNEITGLAKGNYFVWVTDANTCKDSMQSSIEYADCCTPYVPTGFTPNADGKNDVFHIKVKGDMKLVAFKIFNRFGKMVFTTEDVQAGWDGTVNGVLQDIGTYYYFIKATCGNNNEHPVNIKGDVTLIR